MKYGLERADGRDYGELRPMALSTGVNRYAEGSCLIEAGYTRVLCTASVEEKVPAWMKGMGRGWVTAEYAMLPRAGHTRSPRETSRPNSRAVEIRRLIGRSLRPAIDLETLGERTVTLDCDVLQADGGTRTAAITGAWVALAVAMLHLRREGLLEKWPLRQSIAAVSAGLVHGAPLLDLCYEEDHAADVDINVVATGSGQLVEVQGTAEGAPFSREALDHLLDLSIEGIRELTRLQLAAAGPDAAALMP